jgi:hypothetical protein
MVVINPLSLRKFLLHKKWQIEQKIEAVQSFNRKMKTEKFRVK